MNMDYLTEKEQKELKRLQEKARKAYKIEREFWRKVDERKAEILTHFGISFALSDDSYLEEPYPTEEQIQEMTEYAETYEMDDTRTEYEMLHDGAHPNEKIESVGGPIIV